MNAKILFAAAFLALTGSLSAHATSIKFTSTGGTDVVTANLPSTPTSDNGLYFQYAGVTADVNGTPTVVDIDFWWTDLPLPANLTIYPHGESDGAFVETDGDQLYTGTTADPTLVYGTYMVTGRSTWPGGTLVIGPDISATPEPSSLALLGTGVLAGAATLRRRFA